MPQGNDYLVKCPYYKSNSERAICCEGFFRGNLVDMKFRSHTKMLEHKRCRCRTMEYLQCPLAAAINKKYE